MYRSPSRGSERAFGRYRAISAELVDAVTEHVKRDVLVPNRERIRVPQEDIPAMVVDEVRHLVQLRLALCEVNRRFQIGEHILELRIRSLGA